MQSKFDIKLLKGITAFAVLFFFFVSCGSKGDAPKDYTNYEESDFDAFYERFHADTTFQLSRVSFPLEGLPGFADSMTIANGYKWQKEDWQYLKTMDWDTVTQFTRTLEPTGIGIVNEWVCTHDNFCIARRFAKLHDGWHLIYYSDMNKM